MNVAVKCMECMDAGFRMYDGTPSPCPSCDAGAAYEEDLRTGRRRIEQVPRSELIPRNLPPGGDVLITEMKRQAAGLPVGVIGTETLVRAQVESQPLVHELVRLIDDFTRDTPGTQERAVEAMGALPEWAVPDDVREREPVPVTEPLFEHPPAPVLPLEKRQPVPAAKGSSPAAPLEAPGE